MSATQGEPQSLGSEHCVKFSRGRAEPGAGYVGADVLVDGAQSGAVFPVGPGLVGGQEWAQQPVVQLGVEDRDPGAVGGSGRSGLICPELSGQLICG